MPASIVSSEASSGLKRPASFAVADKKDSSDAQTSQSIQQTVSQSVQQPGNEFGSNVELF